MAEHPTTVSALEEHYGEATKKQSAKKVSLAPAKKASTR